jgi:hypothetical protein
MDEQNNWVFLVLGSTRRANNPSLNLLILGSLEPELLGLAQMKAGQIVLGELGNTLDLDLVGKCGIGVKARKDENVVWRVERGRSE